MASENEPGFAIFQTGDPRRVRSPWFSRCWPRRMLPGMKVREVLKLLKSDGWRRVKARGGHRQFRHPTKRGRVTVSGKPSHDLPPGTLNSILKQAGLQP
jgi:predicted RNA binding protein YcfA (HicA-like mRNA interferase family)